MANAPGADAPAVEFAKVTKAHEDLQAAIGELRKTVAASAGVNDRERELARGIYDREAHYAPIALAIVRLLQDGRQAAAVEMMNNDCKPALTALLEAANEYMLYLKQASQADAAAGARENSSAKSALVIVSGLAIALAVAAGWLLTRRIGSALGAEPDALSAAVERIANGDLSAIPGSQSAPAGSVLASMGRMQLQLVQLIENVRQSAEGIATVSAQIASGNQDLSGRTEQQASALEETAASMEQLGTTVRQNADNARQCNQLAQSSSDVASRGGEMVGRVVETMNGISESSKRIREIIAVIDGIAFQTNILALNAAVEAARAGDQGRGFAVVAGEVRTLAQRSAEAAREIKALISTSVERVDQGRELVTQTGATMAEIVQSIHRVTSLVSEIASASIEQSSGVRQVADAVGQMDHATQQNAALVEQSAAATANLKTQSEGLVRAISAFRVVPAQGLASPDAALLPRAAGPQPATLPEKAPQSRGRQIPREHEPALAALTVTNGDGAAWEAF